MIVNNPRKIAKNALIQSLGDSQWNENCILSDRLKKKLSEHPINQHPMIPLLSDGAYDKEKLFYIHMEYRKSIVQVFTDALIMLQYKARDLESTFYPGIKAIPRFLLTLNTLDEFGFRPGFDSQQYYQGNPNLAHYPLYENVLSSFNVDKSKDYKTSESANKLEKFMEDSFNEYILIAGLLAVAEQIVCLFSPPLKANTEAIGLETKNGYYFFHGTSEDKEIEANDDDHEDDLWALITHSVDEDNFDRLSKTCLDYCDLWVEFWDQQMNSLKLP